jgi:HEAT repeat protein
VQAAGFLASCLLPLAADAASLFAAADASALVVRGTVEQITPYDTIKLQVFRVKVGRVLKGEVAVGETIDLAQEMLFASTKPYFVTGTETLMLAVPLPGYSAFRKVLPDGTYWRWTERLETAADVAVLTDPVLTEVVARYLSVRDDAEAAADFFVSVLTGPNARLRQDALSAIGSRAEIPPLLDAGRLKPLAAWLGDTRLPPAERAQVLVQLARVRATGVVELAEGLAATSGALQAAAVDALVSLDKPPPPERLIGWSRSSDGALRLVAARGLAKVGSPAAVDRLAEMLADDPSTEVRVGIAHALGRRAPSARIITLLTDALAAKEKEVVLAAADSLGRLGTHEAMVALGGVLEHGNPDAQMAAAFALKQSNTREGKEILEQVEMNHPDPKVRKLCRLALGESMHEH